LFVYDGRIECVELDLLHHLVAHRTGNLFWF
jgi:hypothetical protein